MIYASNREALPETVFKKNGTIHWRRCADFYGVRRPTLRLWAKLGAPVERPEALLEWANNRNRERLRKIARANSRYAPRAEGEIVRLYVAEKLGLRTISRYFSGRPSTTGVRNVLVKHGVYRSNEKMNTQQARSMQRRVEIVAKEREQRRKIAVCLWRLRHGIGIETTCRENGWSHKTIWNELARRRSYKAFTVRRKRRWPDKRQYGQSYSRLFPKERPFHHHIRAILTSADVECLYECRFTDARTRVDFKVADGIFIECKVGMNSGQTYEFIGQALHYQKHAQKVILCIPSDVRLRRDLFEIITDVGVVVCNELTLASVVTGKSSSAAVMPVIEQQRVDFCCKCCGSNQKRRWRTNSYCVDCASNISTMRFDYGLDRWIPLEASPEYSAPREAVR